MDNRAGEMEVFVAAVDGGGFSAAARRLGLSPSAVSKLVARLEDRLGTRLLVRTTRTLQPTPEGELYLARARAILADIDDAERLVTSGAQAVPRGLLRVSALMAFAERFILPLVGEFRGLYPHVRLDLSLSDDVVDLVGDRTDIAIRSSGALRDTSLKARKLLDSHRLLVASPDYLSRHGTPQAPDDLARHACLGFNIPGMRTEWPFLDPRSGATVQRPFEPAVLVNTGATMRRLCLDGVGIGRIGAFHIQPDVDAGRLVPILQAHRPADRETIHAVFASHEHLAARIRAFIDFLVARIDPA
ncbi:LysR family transcriptional regulator [Rhizobium sp. Leaf384]|uniref:LysR family transcriptional regulator n=1 Tax=unclassified Rhizobium TaxID=2613769 RepID=UPI000714536D|nr:MULTISPECIES: LysR family transcriptional regulator [unclassified Rhizobium]KQR77389.1 LysR family transcriptional regulator [Rhizobium sp. Leaf341]KQS77423.1 LysR family transcriptional regulator [Rhizobium sp. Leaf383]KQS80669.1 LysR family transcriptional regulator [Rhizobium sp. Leaf384]